MASATTGSGDPRLPPVRRGRCGTDASHASIRAFAAAHAPQQRPTFGVPNQLGPFVNRPASALASATTNSNASSTADTSVVDPGAEFIHPSTQPSPTSNRALPSPFLGRPRPPSVAAHSYGRGGEASARCASSDGGEDATALQIVANSGAGVSPRLSQPARPAHFSGGEPHVGSTRVEGNGFARLAANEGHADTLFSASGGIIKNHPRPGAKSLRSRSATIFGLTVPRRPRRPSVVTPKRPREVPEVDDVVALLSQCRAGDSEDEVSRAAELLAHCRVPGKRQRGPPFSVGRSNVGGTSGEDLDVGDPGNSGFRKGKGKENACVEPKCRSVDEVCRTTTDAALQMPASAGEGVSGVDDWELSYLVEKCDIDSNEEPAFMPYCA